MDVRKKTVTGMAEYIERETAQISCRKYSFAESYDAFAVDCILKAIPAADVAPVRHGRWEMNSDRPDNIICTNCDAGFDVWKHEAKDFNYCPKCGAKMDGGED